MHRFLPIVVIGIVGLWANAANAAPSLSKQRAHADTQRAASQAYEGFELDADPDDPSSAPTAFRVQKASACQRRSTSVVTCTYSIAFSGGEVCRTAHTVTLRRGGRLKGRDQAKGCALNGRPIQNPSSSGSA